jgi:hypothetical protein
VVAVEAVSGADRELVPGERLHVTNGESAASTLRATSLDGVVLCWDDVLHEGPLANLPPPELRALRARFYEAHGWGEAAAIAAALARRDELLERAAAGGHPIALWFEHDLFDQLQLLQVLAALAGTGVGQVELVQSDRYLGSLSVAELERLWPGRQVVDAATLTLGRRCWEALCEDRVGDVVEHDTRALPHLEAAMLRLLEEREPLSRTQRQLLRALADGPLRPPDAFTASQAMEEAVFLGDAWCFAHLYELGAGGLVAPVDGSALPLPPPRGEYEAFAGVLLELTDAGRALV